MSSEKVYWDPKKPWGNELVANTLAEQGVECVFTLCGGHIIPMLTAIEQKGIKVVGTRTEEAAILAATGYSVETGKVGVACITAGMLSYGHAAMLTASWGQVPVVVIAGASATTSDGLRDLQEIDQKPIAVAAQVKEAFHCEKWERIPQILTWAFKVSLSGIPGCTFIDFPVDVLCSRGDISEIAKYQTCVINAKPAGDPKLIKEAIKLLASAKSPIITIWRMGVASGLREEIKEFVKITGIPVDACGGCLGPDERNIGLQVCPDADVVLMLGRLSQGVAGGLNADAYTGRIISVYPDAGDIGRCHPVHMGIVGDVKLVMQQMVEEAKKVKFPNNSEWVKSAYERREGAKAMFAGIGANDNIPIHPARLTKDTIEWMIENKINKNAVMGMDGGDSIFWYAILSGAYGVPMEYPGQMQGPASLQITLGSVGMALGLVLGAACARPGKFAFIPTMGDGAIGYHLIELETFARQNIPMVVVLHNNSAWGMVYADQRRIWGHKERAGSWFSENIHYEKAAEALGCAPGEFVTEPSKIRPALDKAYKTAMREKKPVIVNVITDPNIYIQPWPWWTLPATEKGEPYTTFGAA